MVPDQRILKVLTGVGIAVLIGGVALQAVLGLQYANFVVNTLLTVLLVLLYYLSTVEQRKQTDLQESVIETQNKQTELMEYQSRIASVEHDPNLYFRLTGISGDQASFQVYNDGNGPAMNLGLELRIEEYHAFGRAARDNWHIDSFEKDRRNREDVPPDEGVTGWSEPEVVTNLIGDQRYIFTDPPDDRTTDKNWMPRVYLAPLRHPYEFESERFLRPNTGTEFQFHITLPIKLNPEGSHIPFSVFIDQLDTEVESIEMSVHGYFENIGGERMRKELFTVQFDPRNEPSLQNVLQEKIEPEVDTWAELHDDFLRNFDPRTV